MEKRMARDKKQLRRYLGIAGWLALLGVVLFAVHFFTDNKLEGRMSKHVAQVAKQRADQTRPLLAPMGIIVGEAGQTICGIGDPEIGNYDCDVHIDTRYTPEVKTMSGAAITSRLDTFDKQMKDAGWLIDQNDFRSRNPNSRPFWEQWFDTENLEIAYHSQNGAAGCSIDFTFGNNSPPSKSLDGTNIFSCSESKP